jgi:ankyrin repeat protein
LKDPRVEIISKIEQGISQKDFAAIQLIAVRLRRSKNCDRLKALLRIYFEKALFSLITHDRAQFLNKKAGRDILGLFIAEQLIDINCQDYDGSTLLHYALFYRRRDFIRLLLSLDANPFIRDRAGNMAYNEVQPYSLLDYLKMFEKKMAARLGSPAMFHMAYSNGRFADLPPYFKPLYYDIDHEDWSDDQRIRKDEARLIQVQRYHKEKKTILLGMQGNIVSGFWRKISGLTVFRIYTSR